MGCGGRWQFFFCHTVSSFLAGSDAQRLSRLPAELRGGSLLSGAAAAGAPGSWRWVNPHGCPFAERFAIVNLTLASGRRPSPGRNPFTSPLTCVPEQAAGCLERSRPARATRNTCRQSFPRLRLEAVWGKWPFFGVFDPLLAQAGFASASVPWGWARQAAHPGGQCRDLSAYGGRRKTPKLGSRSGKSSRCRTGAAEPSHREHRVLRPLVEQRDT